MQITLLTVFTKKNKEMSTDGKQAQEMSGTNENC
jgi:hypothetical protein